MHPPFHLAFPVRDLEQARQFYVEILGCKQGRASTQWIDLDFYGHQIVAHLKPELAGEKSTNPVDGNHVPVPHFGVVLEWEQWHAFVERLKSKKIEFIIEPHIRFKEKVGEQATCFFKDPSGNAIEMKSFKDPTQLFAVAPRG